MNKFLVSSLALVLVSVALTSAATTSQDNGIAGVEQALQAAQAEPHQEESYQKVYEAFTKLLENVSNNSLGNARRLVSRLNQLVGGKPASTETPAKEQTVKREQSNDERTEQILNRLDKVTKDTDQHTIRQLNEDINKLVGTLNDSYLRNIRRVIERVNKVVGGSTINVPSNQALHQSGDRLEDQHGKQPGFPGWDEFIVAVDRMQKSLAHFVRSSTRLVTSG